MEELLHSTSSPAALELLRFFEKFELEDLDLYKVKIVLILCSILNYLILILVGLLRDIF
ncbi:hypothetical protein ACS0TY_026658 [Phlomoides rotata]